MADSPDEGLQAAVRQVASADGDVSWSICVRRDDASRCAWFGDETVLPTASVGKILLLAEVARRIECDPGIATMTLGRSAIEAVGEAGLWQHMTADTLSVCDLVLLVTTVSDNLATNALLEHFGLKGVHALTRSLGLRETALLDRVRVHRRPEDPPHLSAGNAREWSSVVASMDAGSLVSPAVSRMLRDWLAGNADLSMVVAPFGFDPLAHRQRDGGRWVYNKTGSDPGTRADVGRLQYGRTGVSYAVIARWPETRHERQDVVLRRMQALGEAMRDYLRMNSGPSEGA